MAKVILITGPSGAGKTTTCKEFCGAAEDTWAYVSQDELRQLVVTGYASADDYEYNWTDETRRQWEVSIPVCADIVRRYNSVGINCIVDFFAPPKEFKKWKKHLEGVDYTLFVLLPDEQTTVARNEGRDNRSKLKPNKIRKNYALFEAWNGSDIARITDTSKNSLEYTLSFIRSES